MQDLRSRLTELARNFHWSWAAAPDRIFRSIDLQLWRDNNHNPIAFLNEIADAVLVEKGRDAGILAQLTHAEESLRRYHQDQNHWASWNVPSLAASPVAYFSLEFCIHESLAIYSGGLGVLAGDHLKSCSDLGVPTHGIGLLYRQGYFRQEIDEHGRQHEVYRDLETDGVALEPVMDQNGESLCIEIETGDEPFQIGVWRARVGRCTLLLLDVLDPTLERYPQTLRLYGGDLTTRAVQEVILGIGGYRALRSLGVLPGVIHLNEGHSAFAPLEAIAQHMEATGVDFERAAAVVSETVVFTTHTPVEAGHDRFEPELVLHLLRPLQKRLGLTDEALLGLGRVDPEDSSELFCMTVLALSLAGRTNAVSSLHGGVSRSMWQSLWPDSRPVDVPIGHITNGVHVGTWLADELAQLYASCLGSDWRQHLCDAFRWYGIENLDPLSLWSVKVELKKRLLGFLERREAVRRSRLSKGSTASSHALQLDALTIGFARRFASYKRALLLFRDLERTKHLLTDPDHPVQVVIAGKSHPADEPGKDLLRQLVEISRDPAFEGHVFVLENHDMNVGRHLIRGCDLWLNAPRRPLEACGTSGMKAVFNATLNCSVLDGWWDEGYDMRNGFAFGGGLVHVDSEEQDRRDAEDLMRVLEEEVVPLYYRRDDQGVPVDWLEMVKHALRTLAWRYNSDRMVMDYVRQAYGRAAKIETAGLRF